MPKVKIQKKLSLPAQKLFDAVKEVLTKDKELKALEPKIEICDEKITDKSLEANVNGSRVTGHFCITPDGQTSSIDVQIQLPLMLAPFKSVVQKKIEEKLDKLS